MGVLYSSSSGFFRLGRRLGGVYGLGVGMFPLILTVLGRDKSTPLLYDPY